jgi:CBS domain-containing protein
MAQVADHMSRDVLTVAADSSLRDAAAKMVERAVGAVVVLDGQDVHAILTERDVMKAVASGASGDAPAADWMTQHPDTIEPDDTMDHAASLMIHGGYRHLPVVDGGRLVGIVSIRDLMQVAIEDAAPKGV